MSADAVLLALGGLIQGVMLVAVVGLGWSAWHLGWPEEGDLGGDTPTAIQEHLNGAILAARRQDVWATPEPVAVDGVLGPETDEALVWFQVRHGLAPDGFVGPATLRALQQYERTNQEGDR